MENELRQEHTPPTTVAVTKPRLYSLTEQERVTMVVALRLMQKMPALPNATNKLDELGAIRELGKVGIDALCESINHSGIEFAQITPLFGQDESNPYVARALNLAREGELEVDVPAVISDSEEGAYVMAWMWVSREDAGLASSDDSATQRQVKRRALMARFRPRRWRRSTSSSVAASHSLARLERQLADLGGLILLGQHFSHAGQAPLMEIVVDWMIEHGFCAVRSRGAARPRTRT